MEYYVNHRILNFIRPTIFPTVFLIILPIIYIILAASEFQFLVAFEIIFGIAIGLFFILEFYLLQTVFSQRKGTAKIMINAIKNIDLLKDLAIGAMIVSIILVVFDLWYYEEILNRINVEKIDKPLSATLKLNINGLAYSVFFITFFLSIFRLDSKHNFGRAYAYLNGTSSAKKLDDKMYYIKEGLNSYDNYLSITLDLKINNLNSLYSKFILAFENEQNSMIKTLIKKFDEDTMSPLKYLCKILDMKQNEFLSKKPDYESFERWVKILAPIISAVILFASIILTNIKT